MGMATGPCKWVEVDCPNCVNANRAARRHCDWCNRTGKVTKSIPVGPDISTPSIDIYRPKDPHRTTDGHPVFYLGGGPLKRLANRYPLPEGFIVGDVIPEIVHVGDYIVDVTP